MNTTSSYFLNLKKFNICDTPTRTAFGIRMIFTYTIITEAQDYNTDEFDL